jgi:hypothetical protein
VEFFLLQQGTGISFFENTLPLFFCAARQVPQAGQMKKKNKGCVTL